MLVRCDEKQKENSDPDVCYIFYCFTDADSNPSSNAYLVNRTRADKAIEPASNGSVGLRTGTQPGFMLSLALIPSRVEGAHSPWALNTTLKTERDPIYRATFWQRTLDRIPLENGFAPF